MTKLSDRLEALAEKAKLPQTCSVDGPPNNRIIWSDDENRIAFMAQSGGKDVGLDMARPELLVELVNNLPTIISALQAQENGEK
jgi:hypothetical protein